MENSKNGGSTEYELAIHFWKKAVIVEITFSRRLKKKARTNK